MSWLKPSGLKAYERPIKKGFRGNFSQIKKLLTTGRSICVLEQGNGRLWKPGCRIQREDRMVREREYGLGREPQDNPELGRPMAGFKGEVCATGAS